MEGGKGGRERVVLGKTWRTAPCLSCLSCRSQVITSPRGEGCVAISYPAERENVFPSDKGGSGAKYSGMVESV